MAEGRGGSRGKRKSGPVHPEALLHQLLEESAALQRRSTELAAQIKALQEQVKAHRALPERRRRPRLRVK
jgi:hypothetical protein